MNENSNINDYLKYIYNEQALLFTGAGFSKGAINTNKEPLPTGKKLKELLSKEIKKNDSSMKEDFLRDSNLKDISDYYIDNFSSEKLYTFLKKIFTVSEISNSQKNILGQKWMALYTTNYDNVMEQASIQNGIVRQSVVPQSNVATSVERGTQIVHVNGDLEHTNEANINGNLLLTNSSYTDNYFIDSDWNGLFTKLLDDAKAVIFIGFSLSSDLDLQRIIYANSPNIKSKIFFINGIVENPIEKKRLERWGNVLDLDLEAFSNLISENKFDAEVLKGIEAENKAHTFKSLIKVNYKSVKNVQTPIDERIRLFVRGNINEKYLNNEDYIVQRKQIKNFQLKDNRITIIKSALGNGKTIFMKKLAQNFSQEKSNVYWYNGNPDELEEDLNYLNKTQKKYLIFIDDYYSVISQLSCIRFLGNSIKFILSGRTGIVNQTISDLSRKTGVLLNSIPTYDINYLDKDDKKKWVRNLQSSNIISSNIRLLKSDFTQNFLAINKESSVLNKLKKIYVGFYDADPELFKVISMGLINSLIKNKLEFSQIATLLRHTFNGRTLMDGNVKEFINTDNSTLIIKSAISAKFFLHSLNFKQKKVVEEAMIESFLRAQKIGYLKTYEAFEKNLVSFSNFQLIFEDERGNSQVSKQLNDLANNYYEEIMSSPFAKNNHFFWLQYAIQKMAQGQWDTAEIWLKNAEDKAPKNFDTYQIKTCRFEWFIESSLSSISTVSMDTNIVSKIVSNFVEAESLMNSIQNDERYLFKYFKNIEKLNRIVPLLNIEQKSLLTFCLGSFIKRLHESTELHNYEKGKLERKLVSIKNCCL